MSFVPWYTPIIVSRDKKLIEIENISNLDDSYYCWSPNGWEKIISVEKKLIKNRDLDLFKMSYVDNNQTALTCSSGTIILHSDYKFSSNVLKIINGILGIDNISKLIYSYVMPHNILDSKNISIDDVYLNNYPISEVYDEDSLKDFKYEMGTSNSFLGGSDCNYCDHFINDKNISYLCVTCSSKHVDTVDMCKNCKSYLEHSHKNHTVLKYIGIGSKMFYLNSNLHEFMRSEILSLILLGREFIEEETNYGDYKYQKILLMYKMFLNKIKYDELFNFESIYGVLRIKLNPNNVKYLEQKKWNSNIPQQVKFENDNEQKELNVNTMILCYNKTMFLKFTSDADRYDEINNANTLGLIDSNTIAYYFGNEFYMYKIHTKSGLWNAGCGNLIIVN